MCFLVQALGADQNMLDERGASPLMEAVCFDHLEGLRELLRMGALPNDKMTNRYL